MQLAPLGAADLGLAWLDARWCVRRLNGVASRWLGVADPQQAVGRALTELWPDWPAFAPAEGPPPGGAWEREVLLPLGEGERWPTLLRLDAEGGEGWLLSLRPQPAGRGQTLIDGLQKRVLEAIAFDEPLANVMDRLCREVEELAPEVLCSVLSVDAEGRVHPLAGPRLPAAYSAALDGLPIGPVAGSCGTAAWFRRPIEVRSIATDPLWAPYRDVALGHGLAACWSTPILLDGNRVGATFALYYRHEAPIADYHRELVQACTQLCRVALLNHERDAYIERLAYFDGVTELPNRRLFSQRAEALLTEGARRGEPAALLLLDLDRFKAINELEGHAAGNEVLRAVAQRLQRVLPGVDTLARLGDDEFVLLLRGADEPRAQAAGQAIQDALLAPVCLPRGAELRVALSIGYSLYPDHGQTLEQLLRDADLALHHAKGDGRHCVRGFQPAMARALEEQATLEADLRRAIEAEAFALHFQPKVHLRSGTLLGAEVLIRWTRADGRMVPPDRFIALAEERGLIRDIDHWVLAQACAQLARWRAAGLALPSLAVNLSPPTLQADDIVPRVQGLLQTHGLHGSDLTLEITERLMLSEGGDGPSIERLAALRALGVGVSIDDFGTGYSSLSYLRRLPVSEVKLDRSFVRHVEDDAEDRALTRAVAFITGAMGLSLVAEGVENAAQAALLPELGCQVAQGYWLSRPLPGPAFEDWCGARALA